MRQSELVASLLERHPNLSAQEMGAYLKQVIAYMTQVLVEGQRIEVRDFGSFVIREHPQRQFYNPKTERRTLIAVRKRPFFKASKCLKEQLNKKRSQN